MDLHSLYHFFIMTIETEILRFRDKKMLVAGAVRIVADSAAAGGHRPMHPLILGFELMALVAEFLDRQ